MDWRTHMEATYPHKHDDIADMEHWAQTWTVRELLENNDPDGIVEIVGFHADTYDNTTEEEWSDMCMLFYDWWGCLDLGSSTPEWDEHWFGLLKEWNEE